MRIIRLLLGWILLMFLSVIAPILWMFGYGMSLEFKHKSCMK